MPINLTRATLLASRIDELRDWGLTVRCGCRVLPGHLPVRRLAEAYGSLVTLEAILGRMQRKTCGRPPVRAEAKRGDPSAPGGAAIMLLETKEATSRNRG